MGGIEPSPIMLDSGAYSAWTRGTAIDLPGYIAFCHRVKLWNPAVVYVNLDVIGDGRASWSNYVEMKKNGLEPLPVYHVNTDEKWLSKYLQTTDHLALGALALMKMRQRTVLLDRLWSRRLIGGNRMPIAKVHGMGVTHFMHMARYPWHSFDSTSWLKQAVYGLIYVPHVRGGKFDFSLPLERTAVTPRQTYHQNIYHNTPLKRAMMLRWIKETSMPYGDENTKGVSNCVKARERINLIAFHRFVSNLPYPRPLPATVTPKGGLFA